MSNRTYNIVTEDIVYTIEFYTTENGKTPIMDFIFTLSEKLQAKVLRNLALLEVNGPTLKMPHSKHIRNGIYELRTKESSNITRILYFFYVGRKIILTNGFVKKTQKTPKNEIDLAQKYKTDYERRHRNEQI